RCSLRSSATLFRSSLAQGLLVDVGGIELDPLEKALLAQRLAEQDGRRERLLSGGCPGAPDPDVAALGDNPGQDVLGHVIPGLLVAEEIGDVEEDLVEDDGELVDVDVEVVD